MGDIEGNEEESNRSEDEVAPLVGRSNKSANEASNNHDFVEDESVYDSGPWHAGGQEQVQEKKLRKLSATAKTGRTRG